MGTEGARPKGEVDPPEADFADFEVISSLLFGTNSPMRRLLNDAMTDLAEQAPALLAPALSPD
jgi:hypothetical protein